MPHFWEAYDLRPTAPGNGRPEESQGYMDIPSIEGFCYKWELIKPLKIQHIRTISENFSSLAITVEFGKLYVIDPVFSIDCGGLGREEEASFRYGG
jgi:hypothetical protein